MADKTYEVNGTDDIVCSRTDAVARLILNRPAKRNAMTSSMWAAIPGLVKQLEADALVKAVVLCGAGEVAFSAGADIGEFEHVYGSHASAKAYNLIVRNAQLAVEQMCKPVVAQIYGSCVGGGCGLALACDVRFAAEDARLGITPSKLGVAYSVSDTRRLVALIGPSRAKDLLFSGRLVDANEGKQLGLLDRVVPTASLESTVSAYVSALTANSPLSIRVVKSMINSLSGVDPKASDDLEQQFQMTFESADFQEGIAAFKEKRKPLF